MCASSLVPLPSTAQEIADVIGREATLALARAAQHRVIYVPKSMPANYWIRNLIGNDLANKLHKEFAGMQLVLARCCNIEREERREQILSDYKAGKHPSEIALEHGMCVRWVRKYYLGL